MIYSQEVEMMCPVAQGANHGPAPIPEEAKWVQAKEIKDISDFTQCSLSASASAHIWISLLLSAADSDGSGL